MINSIRNIGTTIAACVVIAAASLGADAKAPKFDPAGRWEWSTLSANGQEDKTVLEIVAEPDGTLRGTLTDRAGVHPLEQLEVKQGKVEFTLVRNTPNGDVPMEYTVKLDDDAPHVSIARPDPAPQRKQGGKKRVTHSAVKRKPDHGNGKN